MLIMRSVILSMLLISFVGQCNKNSCQINNDVDYLNTVPFIILCVANNDFVLPIPSLDYNIPNVDNIILEKSKVGKDLNICPPVALTSMICDESCIIEHRK